LIDASGIFASPDFVIYFAAAALCSDGSLGVWGIALKVSLQSLFVSWAFFWSVM
jgi:hypothetical protein